MKRIKVVIMYQVGCNFDFDTSTEYYIDERAALIDAASRCVKLGIQPLRVEVEVLQTLEGTENAQQ